MERLRTLSEDECYLRCYGWRAADDSVKVLHRTELGASHDARVDQSEAGELLRRRLELRLDARETFEAA